MTDKFPGDIQRWHYESRISPFIGKPVIKIISGIRRSGKSTLLLLVAERLRASGIADSCILYLNMESLDNAAYSDINQLHALENPGIRPTASSYIC